MLQPTVTTLQQPVASPPKGWEPTDASLGHGYSGDVFHILRSQCEELASMWITIPSDQFYGYEITEHMT